MASVQTLRQTRLERTWPPGTFEQIIVDESHHATAENSYGRILQYLQAPRVLGVTATPFRSDGQDVVGLFERCVYTKDLATGITEGYLSPMHAYRIMLEADLDHVRTQSGDFLMRDLGGTMDTPANNHLVVQMTQAHAADRQILAFAASTTHAEHLAAAYQSAGMAAAAVFGSTPSEERTRILQQYHDHDLQILVNYNVLTEGYDEPDVSAVMIVRPTQNPVLLAQMLGRGSRTAAQKDDCLVFDFAGQTTRHHLATPSTLLHQPSQTLRVPTRMPPLAMPTLAANPTAADGTAVLSLPALQAIDDQLAQWVTAPAIPPTHTGSGVVAPTVQRATEPMRPITSNQQAYLQAWHCPAEAIPPTFAVAYQVIAKHKSALDQWCYARHAWFLHTLGVTVPESDLAYRRYHDYQPATDDQQRALERLGPTPVSPEGWSQAEARWLLAHPLVLRVAPSVPTAWSEEALRSVVVLAPHAPQVRQQTWTLIRPTRSDRWIAVSPSEDTQHPVLYVLGDREHPTVGAVFSQAVAQKARTQAALAVETRAGAQPVPVAEVLETPEAIPPSWRRGLHTWFRTLQPTTLHPESAARMPLH